VKPLRLPARQTDPGKTCVETKGRRKEDAKKTAEIDAESGLSFSGKTA
jgi:hypothetical protein